jgi:Sugar (and other) transporter
MLLILAILLHLNEYNPATAHPLVVIFILLFTLCYSPGAGCVPFIYSAEVWPNEGRGMSCLTLLSSPLFRTILSADLGD